MKKQLPPDPEKQNDDRAAWAKSAVCAFQTETGTEDECAAADLLCDLMHLADCENWRFDVELERARMHYEAETTPDASDLLAAPKLVIERWSSGDLAEAVRQLDTAVEAAIAAWTVAANGRSARLIFRKTLDFGC